MPPIDHISRIAIPPAAADELSHHSKRDSFWKRQGKILASNQQELLQQERVREAAVLIPFLEREADLNILLTRRSNNLPQHKGQIAFPGGKIDKTDKDHIAAARRETCEEIGVQPERIDILGKLPLYETGTGFIITPVLGFLKPPHVFVKEQGEVEEIFEVPLSFILNLNNFERRSVIFEEKPREFWALPFKDYFIWGATAAILIDLAERITGLEAR